MTFADYARQVHAAIDAMDARQVARFVELLIEAEELERTVFVIGNGGSAANASHFSQDLSKGATDCGRCGRRIRAISLVDNVSWLTALANDEGYERIFEQPLATLARRGDLLVAISGSGNSPNILNAVAVARRLGVQTVGITGFDGGRLAEIADHTLRVPIDDMGIVESAHAILFHYVVTALQQAFRADVVPASAGARFIR